MKQTVFVPMNDEMLDNLDPEEFARLVPYAYQAVERPRDLQTGSAARIPRGLSEH